MMVTAAIVQVHIVHRIVVVHRVGIQVAPRHLSVRVVSSVLEAEDAVEQIVAEEMGNANSAMVRAIRAQMDIIMSAVFAMDLKIVHTVVVVAGANTAEEQEKIDFYKTLLI